MRCTGSTSELDGITGSRSDEVLVVLRCVVTVGWTIPTAPPTLAAELENDMLVGTAMLAVESFNATPTAFGLTPSTPPVVTHETEQKPVQSNPANPQTYRRTLH